MADATGAQVIGANHFMIGYKLPHEVSIMGIPTEAFLIVNTKGEFQETTGPMIVAPFLRPGGLWQLTHRLGRWVIAPNEKSCGAMTWRDSALEKLNFLNERSLTIQSLSLLAAKKLIGDSFGQPGMTMKDVSHPINIDNVLRPLAIERIWDMTEDSSNLVWLSLPQEQRPPLSITTKYGKLYSSRNDVSRIKGDFSRIQLITPRRDANCDFDQFVSTCVTKNLLDHDTVSGCYLALIMLAIIKPFSENTDIVPFITWCHASKLYTTRRDMMIVLARALTLVANSYREFNGSSILAALVVHMSTLVMRYVRHETKMKEHSVEYHNIEQIVPNSIVLSCEQRTVLSHYLNYAPRPEKPLEDEGVSYKEYFTKHQLQSPPTTPYTTEKSQTIGRHNQGAISRALAEGESARTPLWPTEPGALILTSGLKSNYFQKYAVFTTASVHHELLVCALLAFLVLDSTSAIAMTMVQRAKSKVEEVAYMLNTEDLYTGIFSLTDEGPDPYVRLPDDQSAQLDDLHELSEHIDVAASVGSGQPLSEILGSHHLKNPPLVPFLQARLGCSKNTSGELSITPSGSLMGDSDDRLMKYRLMWLKKQWMVSVKGLPEASQDSFLYACGMLASLGVHLEENVIGEIREGRKEERMDQDEKFALELLRDDRSIQLRILARFVGLHTVTGVMTSKLLQLLSQLHAATVDYVNGGGSRGYSDDERAAWRGWMARIAGERLAGSADPEGQFRSQVETGLLRPLLKHLSLPTHLREAEYPSLNTSKEQWVKKNVSWFDKTKVFRDASGRYLQESWNAGVNVTLIAEAANKLNCVHAVWGGSKGENCSLSIYVSDVEAVKFHNFPIFNGRPLTVYSARVTYQSTEYEVVNSNCYTKTDTQNSLLSPWFMDCSSAITLLLRSVSTDVQQYYLMLISGRSSPLINRNFGPNIGLSTTVIEELNYSNPNEERVSLLRFEGAGYVPRGAASSLRHLLTEMNRSGSARCVERLLGPFEYLLRQTPGKIGPASPFPSCYASPVRLNRLQACVAALVEFEAEKKQRKKEKEKENEKYKKVNETLRMKMTDEDAAAHKQNEEYEKKEEERAMNEVDQEITRDITAPLRLVPVSARFEGEKNMLSADEYPGAFPDFIRQFNELIEEMQGLLETLWQDQPELSKNYPQFSEMYAQKNWPKEAEEATQNKLTELSKKFKKITDKLSRVNDGATYKAFWETFGSLGEQNFDRVVRPAWLYSLSRRLYEQLTVPVDRWRRAELLRVSLAFTDYKAPRTWAEATFEALTGSFIQLKQMKLLRDWRKKWLHLPSDAKDFPPSCIVRAVMGSGKSMVLVPVLILEAWAVGRNVLLIQPEHLMPQSVETVLSTVLSALSARQVRLYVGGGDNAPPIPGANDDQKTARERVRALFASNKTVPAEYEAMLQPPSQWVWLMSDRDAKELLLKHSMLGDPWPWKFNTSVLFDEVDDMFNAFRSAFNVPRSRVAHLFPAVRELGGLRSAYYEYVTSTGFRGEPDAESASTIHKSAIGAKLRQARDIAGTLIHNVHYGMTKIDQRRMIAVPYRYADSPDESSNFSDVDLTALLTAKSKGLAGWDIRDIKGLRALLESWRASGGNAVLDELLESICPGIRASDIFQGLTVTALLEKLQESDVKRTLLQTYCAQSLLPKYLVANATRENISFVDLMHRNFAQERLGFSGTKLIEAPVGAGFEWNNDGLVDEEGDMQIRAAIETAQFIQGASDMGEKKWDLIQSVTQAMMEKGATVLIDVGAVLKDYPSLEVATFLKKNWSYENNYASRVVRIHPDSHKSEEVLFNEKKPIDVVGSMPYTFDFKKPRTLIYFDQQHTVGIDVVMKKDALALVLCTCKSRLTEVAQAIYRLRDVGFGQSVCFYMADAMTPAITTAVGLYDMFNANDVKYLQAMKETSLKQQLAKTIARANANTGHIRIAQYVEDMEKKYTEQAEEAKQNEKVETAKKMERCVFAAEVITEKDQEQEQEREREREREREKETERAGTDRYFACFTKAGGDARGLLHHLDPPSEAVLALRKSSNDDHAYSSKRSKAALLWKDLGIVLSPGATQYFAITGERPDVPLGVFVYGNDPLKCQIATIAEFLWICSGIVGMDGAKDDYDTQEAFASASLESLGVAFYTRNQCRKPQKVGLIARVLVGSPLSLVEQIRLILDLSDMSGVMLTSAVHCISLSNPLFPGFSAIFLKDFIEKQDTPKGYLCRLAQSDSFSTKEKFNANLLGWPKGASHGHDLYAEMMKADLLGQFKIADFKCVARKRVWPITQKHVAAVGKVTVVAAAAGLAYWGYANRDAVKRTALKGRNEVGKKVKYLLNGGDNVPNQEDIDKFRGSLTYLADDGEGAEVSEGGVKAVSVTKFFVQSQEQNSFAWRNQDGSNVIALMQTTISRPGGLDWVLGPAYYVAKAATILKTAKSFKDNGGLDDFRPNLEGVTAVVQSIERDADRPLKRVDKVMDVISAATKVSGMATPRTVVQVGGSPPLSASVRFNVRKQHYYFSIVSGGKRYRVVPSEIFRLDRWTLKVHERGGKKRTWVVKFPLGDPTAKSSTCTISRIHSNWLKLRLGSVTLTPWTEFSWSDIFKFYVPFVRANATARTNSMWAALASRIGYLASQQLGKETYSIEMAKGTDLQWEVLALVVHMATSLMQVHVGSFSSLLK